MDREVLALWQRAKMADTTSARLEQQLHKVAQGQLKIQREPEVKMVMNQKDVYDRSTEATVASKIPKKIVAAPF